MPLDIENFKKEYEKGVQSKANGQITDKKIANNVVGFKPGERDYKEVINDIKLAGQKFAEAGKLADAEAIVNNRLGKNDVGAQRTLDMCTQENVQMLETILLELNKIK